MTPSQLQRRAELLSRGDMALDRWQDRTHPEFIREMAAVAQSLESLAAEADRDGRHTDVVERARTWRHVATAHFDLGRGSELAELERAIAAFERAEKLLCSVDEPLEHVKLAYWFGEALLRLSEAKGMDLKLAQKARKCFAKAIPLARSHMREGVAQLSRRLQDADNVITILGKITGLDGQIDSLRRQIAQIDAGAPVVAEEKEPTSGGPHDMNPLLTEMRRQLESEMATMDPTRFAAIEAIWGEFETVAASNRCELSSREWGTQRAKLDGLLARMLPYYSKR